EELLGDVARLEESVAEEVEARAPLELPLELWERQTARDADEGTTARELRDAGGVGDDGRGMRAARGPNGAGREGHVGDQSGEDDLGRRVATGEVVVQRGERCCR